MVEPIKMGCWAYGRVFWGGLRIIPTGHLGDNKGLKPVEGVSAWLEHRIRRDGRNGFIRRENAQCGTENAGFHLGRFEVKGIFLVCGC